MIEDLEYSVALPLAEQVVYQEGQRVSKLLLTTPHHMLTLFAFDKGKGIREHQSAGDAFVLVLEGEGEFTVAGQPHQVRAGECILMPANVPHAVFAEERFKMLLTVLFPDQCEKGE